jgi:UDP-N-acetyl-2-amino-2-deoxyglucuronate dehydrogenase
MPENFALIGVGGYIAPRHLQAIKDTSNTLAAALDPHDSAGILDRYFDNVRFFTEFERFDRYVDKLRRKDAGEEIHYVSICSPNYLHDAHARFALRVGCSAICEKPVVLNPWNIDALQELENESRGKIYTVLQLRVHPSIIKLKAELEKEKTTRKKEVVLTYITSRGPWYLVSWKGQLEKSGGLATNIGIHFFDMLLWLFGGVQHKEVHFDSQMKTGGYIELERARVKWFLSIDKKDLPEEAIRKGQPTFRSITIDNQELEFSGGFADLHTKVYRDVLDGRGFRLEDARPSIVLAHDIRNARPVGVNSNSHSFLSAFK